MKDIEKRLISEIAEVKREVHSKTVKYIAGAFGLVAGLAWNDAIKACIEYFFPQDQNSLKAKLVYALVVTLVVTIVSFYLMRLEKKNAKKIETENKKIK